MTPSIRNAKTRQRRKERGMVELRVWLTPESRAHLLNMANDYDKTVPEALDMCLAAATKAGL